MLVLSMLFFQISFAQEEIPESPTRERIYTPEQIEMIKAQRALVKENKDAFRSTLSEEQLAILSNKELTRQARKEALMSSLSDAQQALLEANKAEVKA